MADVKYNLEKLKDAKKRFGILKDNLNSLNSDLTEQLQNLQTEWNTPAGKKFFENKQADWSADVTRYTTMLQGVADLLQAAIDEYELIDDEADKLLF